MIKKKSENYIAVLEKKKTFTSNSAKIQNKLEFDVDFIFLLSNKIPLFHLGQCKMTSYEQLHAFSELKHI